MQDREVFKIEVFKIEVFKIDMQNFGRKRINICFSGKSKIYICFNKTN